MPSPDTATEAVRQPWLLDPTASPALPTSLTAKRASDRIRVRLFSDSRIPPHDLATGIVVSEHVNGSYAAHMKRCTIMRWSHHAQLQRVSESLHRLEALGVLAIQRMRTHLRIVFSAEWIALWEPDEARGKLTPGKPCQPPQDERLPFIKMNACRSSQVNRIEEPSGPEPAAAADPPRVRVPADDDQQQQQKALHRIEAGILPGLGAESRRTGEQHSEAWHQRALAEPGTDYVALAETWQGKLDRLRQLPDRADGQTERLLRRAGVRR